MTESFLWSSGTLYLSDFNDVLVFMVSMLSLISKSPSILSKTLGTVPSATSTGAIIVILNIHKLFSSQSVYEYKSIFFIFFLLCGPQERQKLRGKFFFFSFVNQHKILFLNWDYEIRFFQNLGELYESQFLVLVWLNFMAHQQL